MNRTFTANEIAEFTPKLTSFEPEWSQWVSIASTFPLVYKSLEIEASIDASGYGGDLRFFSPEQIVDEAYNCYPGIAATKERFIPIAACESGSGNPYFLKDSSIYRILHEEVSKEDTLNESATEKVIDLSKLLELFQTKLL